MRKLSWAILYGLIALMPPTAVAQPETRASEGISFVCGKQDGIPATIVRALETEKVLILWNAPELDSSTLNPQERCEEVSAKLQTYGDRGELNYLTTARNCPQGRDSCKDFVCVAREKEGDCEERLLFALKSTDDSENKPRAALQQILGIHAPSDRPNSETGDDLARYINFDKYLKEKYAPIEEKK